MKSDRIMILGNGPSLKKKMFPLFKGRSCLGMNAAYRYWDQIGWYPELYCCLDDQVVLSHADNIVRLIRDHSCSYYFLHVNILEVYPELRKRDEVFFIPQLSPGQLNRERCIALGIKHQPSEWFQTTNPSKLTTGSYSVRFAAHMGYREIGLVGTDCRYVEIIKEAKCLDGIALEMNETPENNPNYFFDDYQQSGDRYNIPNPEVHQGNLHLQAFEVVFKDINTFGFDLSVFICTRESEIYDRKVFPFCEIRQFLHQPLLSAVFIPCTSSDMEMLEINFQRWSSVEYQPCGYKSLCDRVALHIAFNCESDSRLEERVGKSFRAAQLSRWFDGPFFHWSGLEGDRDLYTRDFSGKAGPEGYMAGPNNQFFDIINKFSAGMSHVALLEADVVPIRAGWLEEMVALVKQSERFWICGSPYRGGASIQSVSHINGNAIYHVGDPEFQEFMARVFVPYFYERMQTAPHLCYDILLDDMFAQVYSGVADDERLECWKKTASLFRYSEFIVDVSHDEDKKNENLLSTAEARELFPYAFLFHGAVSKMLELTDETPSIDDPAGESRGDVILVDPDASSYFGHFMAYNEKLSGALFGKGWDVKVLCNSSIDKNIVQRYQYFDPCLSFKSWEIGRRKDGQVQAESELYTGISNHIVAGRKTITYSYLGSLELTQVFRNLLGAGLPVFPHINLFWIDQNGYGSDGYITRWEEQVRWLDQNRDKITVTAPTKQIQKDFEVMFGVVFDVALHPAPTFCDDEQVALQAQEVCSLKDRLRIVFPASLRKEKGSDLTLESIRMLAGGFVEGYPIECVLRDLGNIEMEEGDKWEFFNMPGVTVMKGELGNREFKKMLCDSHIAVLPYSRHTFGNRTSGLLIDALYIGLPCIVIKGTWLAGIVEKYKSGVVLESTDAHSVRKGIEIICSDYEGFCQRTKQAACDYAEKHSWAALADSILDADGHGSRVDNMEKMYALAEKTYGASGRNIVNETQGGKLPLFPYQNLAEVLK